MNKLICYFKDKMIFYVFSFSIIGIFYIILYLYHALIDAITYATILAFAMIVVYFMIDFSRYYQKSKQLDYMLSLKDLYVTDLPNVHGEIEKKYQQLFYKLTQLHQSLKSHQDEKYNEMIDYYTLWVHQIKTPISALRLLIQSQEASQNDLFMQIVRIEQYVEMVMHYMKIDHMSSDMRIHRYNLQNILNDVIKKQATFFIHKKIQLQLDPIDFIILTDEKWIAFVLEQILSNSLKYTKQGFIHIYVVDEVLYIEDSGIGIQPEDLPRVVEKGFTGYNGRIDKKASGLGLYLCQKVIDNLGYHLSIESTLHKGTKVAIDFHVDELEVE